VPPLPLVIDLDGTLIFTDMLYESALQFLKKKPLGVFLLLFKLLQGKAALKSFLAQQTLIHAEFLPYNQALIAFIQEQKKSGHPIILCTASNMNIAQRIAEHLNLFDEVIASDEKTNVIADTKAQILNQKFGKGHYIYAGNSKEDIPVWQNAKEAILVNTPQKISQQVLLFGNVRQTLPRNIHWIKCWLKALRVHQWLKNILLFIPLIAAHQIQSLDAWKHLLLAFFAFGFCASSVYITNDLLDLDNDRQHPNKCNRPFASGDLPITQGILAASMLLLLGFKMATFVNPSFVMILLTYYILTSLYSFKLKRLSLIDCLTLAMLYTIRIIAGGLAYHTAVTFWLLACAFFLFYSLALIKRYSELQLLIQNEKQHTNGRDYHIHDTSLIYTLGINSGLASVIIFALYLNSPNVFKLYQQPEIAWASIPVLLFWISWMWQQTHRGHMNDDPVIFAIKNKTSLMTGIVFASLLALATTGWIW
jgi:4-hydroxybenzoate polyprenyltransferase